MKERVFNVWIFMILNIRIGLTGKQPSFLAYLCMSQSLLLGQEGRLQNPTIEGNASLIPLSLLNRNSRSSTSKTQDCHKPSSHVLYKKIT